MSTYESKSTTDLSSDSKCKCAFGFCFCSPCYCTLPDCLGCNCVCTECCCDNRTKCGCFECSVNQNCCKSITCCKCVCTECCCSCAGAFPPDAEAPFSIGCCGFMLVKDTTCGDTFKVCFEAEKACAAWFAIKKEQFEKQAAERFNKEGEGTSEFSAVAVAEAAPAPAPAKEMER
ncbi:hypothetical protein TrCOL_g10081 [Triparma columacea]|uniref:Uncharacterized protein n=1 Tax=Triparma columacea TaxID=722753 RepID=A0A9W7LD30_9STRA|nr:hypothetical protein TrCOL_g10081 [Triparma columacea]